MIWFESEDLILLVCSWPVCYVDISDHHSASPVVTSQYPDYQRYQHNRNITFQQNGDTNSLSWVLAFTISSACSLHHWHSGGSSSSFFLCFSARLCERDCDCLSPGCGVWWMPADIVNAGTTFIKSGQESSTQTQISPLTTSRHINITITYSLPTTVWFTSDMICVQIPEYFKYI